MSSSRQALLILLAGGLVLLAYAYPGLLTLDSVDQLTEGRSGFYTDAHPPLTAMLWGFLDAIVAGPLLMLLLQGATFLAGCYVVLKHAMSPRAAALAAVGVTLFPPVITPLAFIWKDSLMAGLLVLGIGLLLSENRRVRVGALGVLAAATAVKYNAFVATFPAIVLLFELGHTRLKRYAIAFAAWLGVTITAMGINTMLVDQPMYFWHSTLAVWDITGVIAEEDPMSDEQLQRELAGTGLLVTTGIQERARKLYATRDMGLLVLGDDRLWDLPVMGKVPAPEAQRDAISAAWWRLVTGHPITYLRHRTLCFLDIVGVTYKTSTAVPRRVMKYPGFLTQIGLSPTTASWQERWTKIYRWLWKNTPLYTQWIYVVLGLVLLVFARRQRDVQAILASGLLAELSLFAIGPTPDFRYSHWTIVCTLVAATMLVSRRVVAARGTADTPVASPRA